MRSNVFPIKLSVKSTNNMDFGSPSFPPLLPHLSRYRLYFESPPVLVPLSFATILESRYPLSCFHLHSHPSLSPILLVVRLYTVSFVTSSTVLYVLLVTCQRDTEPTRRFSLLPSSLFDLSIRIRSSFPLSQFPANVLGVMFLIGLIVLVVLRPAS